MPDFVIRACSTFLDNAEFFPNKTDTTQFKSQECYVGSYVDPVTTGSKDSYLCFCDDKPGCNGSSTKFLLNNNFQKEILVLMNFFLTIQKMI